MLYGTRSVAPNELMSIPVGSLFVSGEKLPGAEEFFVDSKEVWLVISEGTAILINESFPNSIIKDLDWFEPWKVTILGFNSDYANLMKTFLGDNTVNPSELMSIPIGSVLYIGEKLPGGDDYGPSSINRVWFVTKAGNAIVVDAYFPDSETEDLDWFEPYAVTIIGGK